MMVDLYLSFAEALTQGMLRRWHRMLMTGSRGLANIGRYRTGAEGLRRLLSLPVTRTRLASPKSSTLSCPIPFSSPASWVTQIQGWLSDEAMRASLSAQPH